MREATKRVLLALLLGAVAVLIAAGLLFASGQGNGAPLWAVVLVLAVGVLLGRTSDQLFDFALKKDLSISCNPLDGSVRPWRSPALFIGMAWNLVRIPGPPHPQVEIHADCGVLRVTTSNGQARGCRASLRVRYKVQSHDARSGRMAWIDHWMDGGNLNWFSPSKRHALTRLDSLDIVDLAGHLENPQEDLDEGVPKDLQLCYLPQGWLFPVICGDSPRLTIATPLEADGYARFLAEITLTAASLKTAKFYFQVRTKAGTIELQRVEPPADLVNHYPS